MSNNDAAVPHSGLDYGAQIALTARNNGDGTWSVTRGPGGVVLKAGLTRRGAVTIVSARTGILPSEPTWAAQQRAEIERKVAEMDAKRVAPTAKRGPAR